MDRVQVQVQDRGVRSRHRSSAERATIPYGMRIERGEGSGAEGSAHSQVAPQGWGGRWDQRAEAALRETAGTAGKERRGGGGGGGRRGGREREKERESAGSRGTFELADRGDTHPAMIISER